MSKNVKGILGDQYGKVGPVVGRKFRNENVYTAYQKNVANPRTAKQENHRLHFKVMSQLAHNMACGARMGFVAAAKGTKRSPRNLFQKVNWENITVSGTDTVNIDYTALVLAKGGLAKVFCEGVDFNTPLTVTVELRRSANACQCTPNDKAYVVVYCPDFQTSITSDAVDIVNVATANVQVPTSWMGLKVHAWCFMRNNGEENAEFGIAAGECSDSEYCGNGIIG